MLASCQGNYHCARRPVVFLFVNMHLYMINELAQNAVSRYSNDKSSVSYFKHHKWQEIDTPESEAA